MSDTSTLSNLASQASGARATPAPVLKAGQVVAAQVVALMKDGMVRLALPQGTVDVVPPTPLPQGATVKLEVVKTGAELVLRLMDSQPQPPQQQALARGAIPQAETPPPAGPGPAAAAAAALPRNIPASFPDDTDPSLKPTPNRPLEGRVVALGQEGAVRIATPRGEVTVNLRMPVPLGAAVRVELPATGQPALSVISATAQPPAAARPMAPAAPPPAGPGPQPDLPAMQPAATPRSVVLPTPAPAHSTPPTVANNALAAQLARVDQPMPGQQGVQAQPAGSSPGPLSAAPATSAKPAPAAVLTLPTTPPANAPLPTGPMRVILLPALQSAVGQQQPLAPLMANLEAAITPPAVSPTPPGTPAASPHQTASSLPAPVAAAAEKVLSARLPLDRAVTGEDIARAVAQSGVLFEAKLAAGTPPSAMAGDLKGALLLLRNALRSFLGETASTQAGQPPARDAGHTPPPLRGDPPTAQRPAAPTISADAPPEEIGRTLLSQTEGALARTRLSQMASLPDDAGPVRTATPAPLHVEIPIVLGQQNAVAQFTVERDGHHDADTTQKAAVWRMRFAFDVEPMGPVHALVTLRGETTAITLWAERPETAAELAAASHDLRRSLDDAAFAVEDVVIHRGVPPKPARQPGGMLDRRT